MTEFDKATERIPKWILACPIAAHWLEYKGETYFGMLNYERSIKARRPMIDLCYCATEAAEWISDKDGTVLQEIF